MTHQTQAAPTPLPKRRNSGLDAMRALAALLVVAIHFGGTRIGTDAESLTSLIVNAEVRVAVPLFFMLTGTLLLSREKLDVKQNRTMALLTVITTIFMPLTLIAGWYGMNFKYMPELEYKWAYPAVIAVSIIIVIVSLLFFKKKKWL